MKTVMVVLGLSLVSAFVGVFAATELHEMRLETNLLNSSRQATTANATQPSQKIQQWVNQ